MITSDSVSWKWPFTSFGDSRSGLLRVARSSGEGTSKGIQSKETPFSRAQIRTRQANGHSRFPWISIIFCNLIPTAGGGSGVRVEQDGGDDAPPPSRRAASHVIWPP